MIMNNSGWVGPQVVIGRSTRFSIGESCNCSPLRILRVFCLVFPRLPPSDPVNRAQSRRLWLPDPARLERAGGGSKSIVVAAVVVVVVFVAVQVWWYLITATTSSLAPRHPTHLPRSPLTRPAASSCPASRPACTSPPAPPRRSGSAPLRGPSGTAAAAASPPRPP